MASFGVCNDISDAIELSSNHQLYLKPIAKLNISVQLPVLNTPGKSISNWEVMERLKSIISPDHFTVLKVAKSSLEMVKFEGEIENKSKVKKHIAKLDGRTIKLSGFSESLKVKATEFKSKDPSKHDWDAFFRDAQDMDEMKAGERPDTINLKDLPCRWFSNKKQKDKPNEEVIKSVFENYGIVSVVDIPCLNPCNKESGESGFIQTFTFGQDFLFEVFIQFKEYNGFVRAMNALRGMKLMLKDEHDKALTAAIRVDFDRTKHLSARSVRRRDNEKERLSRIKREKEEEENRKKEAEIKRIEEEKFKKMQEELEAERKEKEMVMIKEGRRKEREEMRRMRRMTKKKEEESKRLQDRINMEERKILIAKRKLQSIRLFSELFNRTKKIKQQDEVRKKEKEAEEGRRMQVEDQMRRQLADEQERLEREKMRKGVLEREEEDIRKRIMKNFKVMEGRKLEKRREEVRKKVSGKLKSAIVIKR